MAVVLGFVPDEGADEGSDEAAGAARPAKGRAENLLKDFRFQPRT
jgi:hypothetical protein